MGAIGFNGELSKLERCNPVKRYNLKWIPACAGMTELKDLKV
jgi:hypothetical protein